jgi:hypothetical protein
LEANRPSPERENESEHRTSNATRRQKPGFVDSSVPHPGGEHANSRGYGELAYENYGALKMEAAFCVAKVESCNDGIQNAAQYEQNCLRQGAPPMGTLCLYDMPGCSRHLSWTKEEEAGKKNFAGLLNQQL